MRIQFPGTSLAPRTCRQCGRTFIGGPRAWYCPDCRKERKKKQDWEYGQRRRAGKCMVMGKTRGRCEVCGAEFVYGSARQKYCPSCAREACAAVDREQGRGWLKRAVEKHGQRYVDELKAAKRLNRTSCVDCGAPLAEGHGSNKEYCPVCEQLHLKYRRYKAGCKRKIPPREPVSFEKWKVERGKRYCVDCGVLLPPDVGRTKKYCAACKELHLRYTSYKMLCKHSARPVVSFGEWKSGKR